MRRKMLWMAAALAAGTAVMLLPTPEGLTPTGHRYLALLAALVVMFFTEPIPLPLVMAAGGCGLVLLDVGSAAEV